MTKAKLTKRKALEICLELWEWLTETGSSHKEDWPGWKRNGRMDCDCPCCEYTNQHDCFQCPIWGNCAVQCISSQSPFHFWCHAGYSKVSRQKYALKMVTLIKSKLAELK